MKNVLYFCYKLKAMATLRYFLRSSPKNTDPTIRVRFRHGKEIDLNGVTTFVIPVSVWDKDKQRISKKVKYDDSFTFDVAQFIISRLDSLETFILDAFNTRLNDDLSKTWLQSMIDTYYKKIEYEEKKTYLEQHPEEVEGVITLNSFIVTCISDVETCKMLTAERGERFAFGTVKSIKGFQVQFNEYQQKQAKVLDFDNITMDFYFDFKQ